LALPARSSKKRGGGWCFRSRLVIEHTFLFCKGVWDWVTGKACREETHSLRNRVLGAKRREKKLRN
jgi:hypothetical protein